MATDLRLSDAHRQTLEVGSGISSEVIAARGYRTVETAAELGRLGFGPSQRLTPTLLIPIWNVRGDTTLYQSRPEMPRVKNGKAIKYETPRGSVMVLDVHPFVRQLLVDPGVPLFITEGIKKGDALVSKGLCAIALLGVWNWRGTNGTGGKTALADWEHVALNDRRVYVVFDADVMTNPVVHTALVRLAAFLKSRGAD